MSTTLCFSGLHHAACLLAPSSSVRPWLGVHVECAPDRLARLGSGGTCTSGAHPLGHTNQFHGLSPNSQGSGFPWRDHHMIRWNVAFSPGNNCERPCCHCPRPAPIGPDLASSAPADCMSSPAALPWSRRLLHARVARRGNLSHLVKAGEYIDSRTVSASGVSRPTNLVSRRRLCAATTYRHFSDRSTFG